MLIKLTAKDARLKRGGLSLSDRCQRGTIKKANHTTHRYTVQYTNNNGENMTVNVTADNVCLMTREGDRQRVAESRVQAGLPGTLA